MMYQMQNFVNTFGDICEFVFLDGPMQVTAEPPIKFFVDKGIVPPYKCWMKAKYFSTVQLPDGGTEVTVTKVLPNFNGAMETIYYLAEFMNK